MERELSINDIAAYLDEIGLQYMAAIGLDGKPKVRPVQYMILRDDKLWFCTNSEKAMYEELQKSPFIDLCGSRLQKDEITTAWIRFSAEAVFPAESEEIRGVKKAIMQKSKIVRELYNNNQEHPLFKVFYSCGGFNTPAFCVVIKGIKADCNHLMRTTYPDALRRGC